MGERHNDKIRIVRFGNPFLDDIDSMDDDAISRFAKKYGIDTNRTVVVMGYNRTRGQQHTLVAKSFIDYKVDRNRIFIVIPWTSGPCDDPDAYRREIEDVLKDNYDY